MQAVSSQGAHCCINGHLVIAAGVLNYSMLYMWKTSQEKCKHSFLMTSHVFNRNLNQWQTFCCRACDSQAFYSTELLMCGSLQPV